MSNLSPKLADTALESKPLYEFLQLPASEAFKVFRAWLVDNPTPAPQPAPITNHYQDWVTREQALELFDITDPTLNKWVKNGRIVREYIEGKPFYQVSSAYNTLNNKSR